MPMTVEILTPRGTLYEAEDAARVAAPGAAGNLEIEPGHINLVTTLRIGRLRIDLEGEAAEHFAIHGGFLEASPERVRVLADAAEKGDQIDIKRAEAARRRAEQHLRSRRKREIDVEKAEAALRRALVRLGVAEMVDQHRRRRR